MPSMLKFAQIQQYQQDPKTSDFAKAQQKQKHKESKAERRNAVTQASTRKKRSEIQEANEKNRQDSSNEKHMDITKVGEQLHHG
jgi:hypothetical protein